LYCIPGLPDGKEVVNYRSMNSEGTETSSVADGKHNSLAQAADATIDMGAEMAMMGRAFGFTI